MFERLFNNILHEDEEEESISDNEKPSVESDLNQRNDLLLAGLIFIMALVPRIIYLFFLSDPQIPGFYTDTYHHWQVAYLSKEIGFSHGFLRLWDFKGMEYFWGLLHPLVLSIIFTLTGSISIVIPRLLSAVGGSVTIALLFLLIKRHFNHQTAWAAAIFAIFFPITLFSNTSGMQEELGMPLILAGLLLWPKRPFLIGLLFGFASMVRAEYWLFAFGLIISAFITRRNLDKAIVVFFSYAVVILIYMKYLATWTNNYIYPIYWNFLANAKGAWAADIPIIGEKLLAKQISQGIFAFGLIGGLITLVKRPRYALFFLFGFMNIVFIGFMLGFSAYVKGYFGRFWLDRLYNWPYLFTVILVLIFLFYTLPKLVPVFDKIKLNWTILLLGIILSQYVWYPINFYMKVQGIKDINRGEKEVASQIAGAYRGGKILMPEDHAAITYFLAHDFDISGEKMVGQMFDPFFYFKNQKDPFLNWGEDRIIVLNWLKKEDIRLIALTAEKPTYLGLVEREPSIFKQIPSKYILLYEVILDKVF